MVACETCGRPLAESAGSCSHGAQPSAASAPGHLSRVAIAGSPGATQYGSSAATQVVDTSTVSVPHQFSSGPRPSFEPPRAVRAESGTDEADDVDYSDDDPDHAHAAQFAAADGSGFSPASPATASTPDWDPDATTRFMPAYGSHNDVKNTVALVALAITLVLAVSSLAWLIGQSVSAGRPLARPSVAASPTATPISTVVPKNATVCTPEVARSTNTSCTLARRVLSAVRVLGTDLPDTFRVTAVNPQTAKNATFVCSIKSWIQCVGPGDVTVYVLRQV